MISTTTGQFALTAAPIDTTLPLSKEQIQTLLQYLYSERAETRLEALRHIIAYEWYAAQVRQALEELAALDETPRVRGAARDALRGIEMGVS